jgi:uncharacterized Rmd1/YagE family protein
MRGPHGSRERVHGSPRTKALEHARPYQCEKADESKSAEDAEQGDDERAHEPMLARRGRDDMRRRRSAEAEPNLHSWGSVQGCRRSGLESALTAMRAALLVVAFAAGAAFAGRTAGIAPLRALSFLRKLRPTTRVPSARRGPKPAPVALQWKSTRTSKKRFKRGELSGARITAYCFCDEVDVEALSEAAIAQDGRVWAGRSFEDVWHLSSPSFAQDEEGSNELGSDIFILPYGCIVFWNLRRDEELSFLDLLRPFASQLLKVRESDSLTLALLERAAGARLNTSPTSNASASSSDLFKAAPPLAPSRKVSEEVVTLETEQPAEKLAVSCGLAQSVKLSVLESQLDECVSEIRHIPDEMSRTGKVRCSAREVSQLTGKLFLFRSEVNLYSDILDGQPTWFWDNEDFAPQYEAVAEYLDLQNRVDVYNQRLDIVGELVDNLNDRLNHSQSAKLEWIIIWLITVEIVMGFVPHSNVVGIVPRLSAAVAKLLARGGM